MSDHADRCTEAQTPSLQLSIGAYVLGALEPAETDEVTEHLVECQSCREEYLELLDLVPLLASVTEADAVHGPPEPDPDVLGQALAAWRLDVAAAAAGSGGTRDTDGRRRRLTGRYRGTRGTRDSQGPLDSRDPQGSDRSGGTRSSRRRRLALAAACVALVVGIGAIGVLGVRVPSGDPGTQTSWNAVATSNVDPDAYIEASVQVSAATWGSAIELTIQDVPKGYECTMIVITSDGRRETAGTWKAPSSGTVTIPGTVGLDPDQIASIQVQLPSGRILLTLNRP